MGRIWDLAVFVSLYDSIEQGSPDAGLAVQLKEDLVQLTLMPKKNDKSRQQLETGKVLFNDGEYEINEQYKVDAVVLSDELNIDELVAAELLHTSPLSTTGISLVDSARANYYLRKQNILAVVSYIINSQSEKLFDAIWDASLIDNLLSSFKDIEEELDSIHQLVQRSKILGQHESVEFQQKLTFRRDFLKAEHETLGEILYGIVSRNLITKDYFMKVLSFVSVFDIDDFFLVHFLPGLILFCSKLKELKDEDVKQLHSDFLKELRNVKRLYEIPVKSLIILIFLTYFIEWCKESPQRQREFDFDIAIESPMVTAVQLGAIEQLLIVAADTSDSKFEPFYDIRSLLQQHLPRLVSKRILDVNEEETRKLRLTDTQTSSSIYVIKKDYKLSQNLTTFLTTRLHDFVQTFIAEAAFLLIKIKDAEEDSLLSGEDSLLDDISKKADLERFYISVFYLYVDRESLISTFWEDRESNLFGFIEWASKGEDLLMKSAFVTMLSALASGPSNALHVYHFIASSEKLSWMSIVQILIGYTQKIQAFEQNGDDNDLSEEIILTIASFFTLIYQTAINNDAVRLSFDESLLNCLFNFIRLDTPLVGAALHVVRSLVCDDEERKILIWNYLDAWLFLQNSGPFKETFHSVFVTFPDILGFINLVDSLLQNTSKFGKLGLPYPADLGNPYRKQGFAPYLDFILTDVFYHSPALYYSERVALQAPILRILKSCLSSFDPNLILNCFPAAADLNKVVTTLDFSTYIQANPAPLAMNFLFQEKIYKILFDILSTGVDNIVDKSFDDSQVQVVGITLGLISSILDLEVTYIDELLPIFKKESSLYIPKSIGTHGLRSFYDAILFHLPIIAHISLYVGSSHLQIASKSLELLQKFSKSSQFGSPYNGGSLIGRNRLLTTLESIDESLRIKYGFINQLKSEITSPQSLSVKISLLNLINQNISISSKNITISHFLLGFDSNRGLSLGDTETFINSEESLLKTIIYILESSLLSISNKYVDYAPIRLSSLSLEIVLKLCRNSLTSSKILQHISNYNLVETLLATYRVDLSTLWNGEKFNSDMESGTDFNQGPSIGALLAFMNFRSHILQYFSLELHRTSSEGSISKTSSYIQSLIFGSGVFIGPPKVLTFLDILEFKLDEIKAINADLSLFKGVDLSLDLNKVELSLDCNSEIFELKNLDSILDLHLRSLWVDGQYHTDYDVNEQDKQVLKLNEDLKKTANKNQLGLTLVNTSNTIKSDEHEAKMEEINIKTKFSNYLASIKFKSYQLSALHSWVQLIQIVVTDGKLEPIKRSNFVLEIFQVVVPRINDYVEYDVLFAEELVSLCVSLYDIYHQDRESIEQHNPNIIDGYERLYALFKSCINGILSPLSTLGLRSDLYVLSNKYLSWILKHPDISRKILQSIKLSNDRLISVICNDAIGGEGATRITGLLFLESLFQLSNVNQINFVLNTLVKNNLLLLLVKSIKRTDETLLLSHENKITLDNLLYELTAFKATLSFLIRVAQSRHGAQQLLQSEIFQTIKSCSFLLIDPDLGLELVFDESTIRTSTFVRVNLNLDAPLSFDNSSKGVSLFELLVPTFQLVSAILLSTSSENKPVIQQVKSLLRHFRKLVIGVLKRDVLVETRNDKGIYKNDNGNTVGLKDLVKLLVLLSTLTNFDGFDN